MGGADVVVESFNPETMEDMGLGFDALEKLRPGIVLTSITPFGQTGPWRDFQATDLVEYAASGLSYVNGIDGQEPLCPTLVRHPPSCQAPLNLIKGLSALREAVVRLNNHLKELFTVGEHGICVDVEGGGR